MALVSVLMIHGRYGAAYCEGNEQAPLMVRDWSCSLDDSFGLLSLEVRGKAFGLDAQKPYQMALFGKDGGVLVEVVLEQTQADGQFTGISTGVFGWTGKYRAQFDRAIKAMAGRRT